MFRFFHPSAEGNVVYNGNNLEPRMLRNRLNSRITGTRNVRCNPTRPDANPYASASSRAFARSTRAASRMLTSYSE